MILRRTLEGALKCSLRDLRLEEWRATTLLIDYALDDQSFMILTLANLAHYDCVVDGGWLSNVGSP